MHGPLCCRPPPLAARQSDILGVSDVQVYYLDSGEIGVKVDVWMDPSLTIAEARGA